MPSINQASFDAVRPELSPGETILWAGQPTTRVIFHKYDAFLIPFTLLWGGFSIFWEAAVSGLFNWGPSHHVNSSWLFGMVWGAAFVLIGQYLIWGRFLHAAWRKKTTHYAVTNRRVIIMQTGWLRRTDSGYIETLPCLIRESGRNGIGTIQFAPRSERSNWGNWNPLAKFAFIDLEDVEHVYKLILGVREKEPIRGF